MNIDQIRNGDKLTLAVGGRIDTKTSPQLEKTLDDVLEGIKEFVFDFADVSYISSAGLRVLMAAQLKMNEQGRMTVINANEDLMEIFEITGFTEILTIE